MNVIPAFYRNLLCCNGDSGICRNDNVREGTCPMLHFGLSNVSRTLSDDLDYLIKSGNDNEMPVSSCDLVAGSSILQLC
jgi:hypothetical protein